MATQNLGNVRALIVSTTAPTNTNLIWRDISTTPHTTKLYDTQTSTWVAISMTGGTSDPDAIHVNIAGEIAAIVEKVTPINTDFIVIEDSADSNNKKRVQVGNLPTPVSDITRTSVAGGQAANPWNINFANRNEYFTSEDFTLNMDTSLIFTNPANAELGVIDVVVTNATRTITMPLRTYMQSSDTRWTASSRELELPVGRYKLTFKRGNDGTNTIWTIECSDTYVTT